jgi:hypothetical protein
MMNDRENFYLISVSKKQKLGVIFGIHLALTRFHHVRLEFFFFFNSLVFRAFFFAASFSKIFSLFWVTSRFSGFSFSGAKGKYI